MIQKTKIFKVVFETASSKEKESATLSCVFTWDLIRNKYVYVVAGSIEEALLYVRKNFAAITSRLEFMGDEIPVDIKEISLYQDCVYA